MGSNQHLQNGTILGWKDGKFWFKMKSDNSQSDDPIIIYFSESVIDKKCIASSDFLFLGEGCEICFFLFHWSNSFSRIFYVEIFEVFLWQFS